MVGGMNSMGNLNIFETIQKAQPGRTEPFHSQFLADAMAESLKPGQDRSLFDGVWQLTTTDWEVPEHAEVIPEKDVGEQKRIDICVVDKSRHRVLGIEVKTRDDSAEHGQLASYRDGLNEKYDGWSIAIAYLTPFNRERARDNADFLQAVQVFDSFSQESPGARHVSWLDVADIAWDGRELWKQHQAYVRNSMSSYDKLGRRMLRDRGFDHFFGEPQADEFWEALHNLGVEAADGGADIELSRFENITSVSEAIVRAFEILIMHGDGVLRGATRENKFPEEKRRRFLNSQYHEVHAALFYLSDRFDYVWVDGSNDYAIRIAHNKPQSRSVSLVRSCGEGRLGSIGVHR